MLQLRDFNTEFTEKQRSVEKMWILVAGLGHWLLRGEAGMAACADDGDRVNELTGLVGCALLTALHSLDVAGKLTNNSDIRDLGLVMSLYLHWTTIWGDMDEEELEWRKKVVGYAKKAGIDLEQAGCASMKTILKEFERVRPITVVPKNMPRDRWAWKRKLSRYRQMNGLAVDVTFDGHDTHDITKWTRAQRAQFAFDQKDPLADIPEDDLKNNRIALE
jgi:hypothetical protein